LSGVFVRFYFAPLHLDVHIRQDALKLKAAKKAFLNESCTAIVASVKNNERCFDVFNVG
jgi:hypothetical protein